MVDTQDTHITPLSYSSGKLSILLLNVYLPIDCARNKDEQMYLGKLVSLIDDALQCHICTAGDFNAKPSSEAFKDLEDVLREWDMIVADVSMMPSATFKHVNFP
ncbi:hypothetical protein E2C01_028432 [Portunus trituberculatus]|uniref:Endonuclease/exonuclease/phosphatase domain-containing protein n=1 Tax=Portunus trituberculatus TaxID=210409 RepID=A0A5B7ERP1_PORTR|nr:hypothetical protein [Portunus trituberculatus]